MSKILITGTAASGKTTLANHLRHLGYHVIETDPLCSWRHTQTNTPATYEQARAHELLAQIGWMCDIERLKTELAAAATAPVFVCGYSDNQAAYFDTFDAIFSLEISDKELRHRLKTRTTGDWGKHPVELQHVLDSKAPLRALIERAGGRIISGEQPTPIIASEILGAIHEH